ncbi:MAG: hypothetical protein HS116_18980 [Planctomycetes bacterium]|nr:hypothetical protein [Planctomycetota bacterium]
MAKRNAGKTSEGRTAAGRFAPGNPGGPGNPYARRVAQLRQVLLDAVSDKDLVNIAKALVAKAKKGDVHAAREVWDRLMGKPVQPNLELGAKEELIGDALYQELAKLWGCQPGMVPHVIKWISEQTETSPALGDRFPELKQSGGAPSGAK